MEYQVNDEGVFDVDDDLVEIVQNGQVGHNDLKRTFPVSVVEVQECLVQVGKHIVHNGHPVVVTLNDARLSVLAVLWHRVLNLERRLHVGRHS